MVPASLSAAYRRFWHEVGETFPDLGGAASTAYYLENEKRLLSEHLPDLGRCALLKTDLWDEVKNTRILQWARAQGASVYGVDISEPTVRQARAAFADAGLRAAVADVRSLPFRDGSFDAIYSMGTIEHFPDSETALREMHRVLRPGGRAVVGVPNRWDPFLRPLAGARPPDASALRLRLRAVVLAPGAAADAGVGGLRGGRGDGDPVRAGMAAHGRPRPAQLRAAARAPDRRRPRALRVARRARAGGAPARLPPRVGRASAALSGGRARRLRWRAARPGAARPTPGGSAGTGLGTGPGRGVGEG